MPNPEIPGPCETPSTFASASLPLIEKVPAGGIGVGPTFPPSKWRLTREGAGELALHRETEAEGTPTGAESDEQPPPPGEPPRPRLTVDSDRMGATLDGVFLECDSKQALRLLKVYADHPGVWISVD